MTISITAFSIYDIQNDNKHNSFKRNDNQHDDIQRKYTQHYDIQQCQHDNQ